jgi:ABC-type Na+ efflux pump, permease component
MKKFLAFFRKEFLHIFRDYRTLLILFGMPIVQVLIFGFAISNEIRDSSIAILDESKDNITMEISNKLLSSGYFKLYDNLKSINDIDREFKKGIVKEVIIFEPQFSDNLYHTGKASVQLIADASDPNYANMIISYTSAIINDYQMSLMPQNTGVPQIDTEVKMIYNPNLKSVFLFVPGLIAVILLLICTLMTSISITREKELGTMEVLLVSPLNPLQIILGKVLPYFILSFVNAIVILLLGKFIFEIPIAGSIVLILLETILFVMTALRSEYLSPRLSETSRPHDDFARRNDDADHIAFGIYFPR